MHIAALALLLCPPALTAPHTPLPKGCRAPAAGFLYTAHAVATQRANLAACERRAHLRAEARDAARAETDAVALRLAARLGTCAADLRDAGDELDASASAVDALTERASALERDAAARLPAWAWTLAGAAAMAAPWGAERLGLLSAPQAWGVAGAGVVGVVGWGVVVEW